MDDWEFADLWDWEDEDETEEFFYEMAHGLSAYFFISDGAFMPDDGEDYDLGHLDVMAWWPLMLQLDGMLNLEALLDLAIDLEELLGLEGVPTQVLEEPAVFLARVLEGNLPRLPSGRRVGSPKLVKIALLVARLLVLLPETAQAAVRAWADVHRYAMLPVDFDEDDLELADLLFAPDLPPAMTGFSMLIALTLMRWPERAEGLPLPPGFIEPDLYDEVLAEWESLPDSPAVTEEGTGEAEALFAQGQLAHTLAQMGSAELLDTEGFEEEDLTLAYSQLSRAILWVHNQCRHCQERDEVTCRVASAWAEQPASLLDVASEIANTSRITGCVKM